MARAMEEWLEPREIMMQEMNSLRGRLCTVIEGLGLPPKQTKAIVLLIKQASYQQQYTLGELLDTLDSGTRFRYVAHKLEQEQ